MPSSFSSSSSSCFDDLFSSSSSDSKTNLNSGSGFVVKGGKEQLLGQKTASKKENSGALASNVSKRTSSKKGKKAQQSKSKSKLFAVQQRFNLITLREDIEDGAAVQEREKETRATNRGWSRFEIRCFFDSIDRYGKDSMRKVQVCVATKTLDECVEFWRTVQDGSSAITVDKRLEKRRQRMNKYHHRVSLAPNEYKSSLLGGEKSSSQPLHSSSSCVQSTRKALRRLSVCGGGRLSLAPTRRNAKTAAFLPSFAPMPEDEIEIIENGDGSENECEDKEVALQLDTPALECADVLSRVFEYLHPSAVLSKCCRVSKFWNQIGAASANLAAALRPVSTALNIPWTSVIDEFPKGTFLSEGSYKQVYKVYSKSRDRDEAISIMDVGSLLRDGGSSHSAQIIESEVSMGLATTALVENSVCPNFVQVFQVFQLPFPPPGDEWCARAEQETCAANNNQQQQLYQYIRMELCSGGDVEEFIKRQRNAQLDLKCCIDLLFQMLFAVYAGREQLNLRHHDLKLLNFFIKKRNPEEAHAVQYAFERRRFESSCGLTLKMADYGTADANKEFVGKDVELRHFGTLENTPPECFLLQHPKQSWATDTFPLGLAALHLFTGGAPYEEVLDGVACPQLLREELVKEWRARSRKRGKEKGHFAMACLLDDGDESVLVDTIYKYIVMLGLPSAQGVRCRVSSIIDDCLESSTKAIPRGKKGEKVKAARATYASHCAQYSLSMGSAPLIARGRERMRAVSGAWDLVVNRMLSFDPAKRPTMKTCLLSEAFASMECLDASTEMRSFEYYAKSECADV